jgi:hypothetical protein
MRSRRKRAKDEFTEDIERTYKTMLMAGKFAYELPEFKLVDYLTSKTRMRKRGGDDDKS